MKKLNIVGNACFATFCTRDYLKQEYVNPFIWCEITFPNMYKLISHWDEINFSNIKIRYNEKDNNYTIILLDYDIELLYLHYRNDPNAKTYTARGNDAFYYDMPTHLLNQWNKHLSRMIETKPIFAVMQTNGPKWDFTDEEIAKIKSIKTKYPLIVWNKKMDNFKAAKYLHRALNDLGYLNNESK